jgi:hypothetical protein
MNPELCLRVLTNTCGLALSEQQGMCQESGKRRMEKKRWGYLFDRNFRYLRWLLFSISPQRKDAGKAKKIVRNFLPMCVYKFFTM